MRISERVSGPPKPVAAARSDDRLAEAGDLDPLLERLHAQVVDRLDMTRIRDLDAAGLRERIAALVDQLLAQAGVALSDRQRTRVVGAVVDEIIGLGPLEPLLADPAVSDILVNTASKVYIERKGVLELTQVRFRDNAHLLNTINRIVARVGRRIDESSPMVDARLPDGSRVNAVIGPLAIDGPLLCIRRFGTGPVKAADLVQRGALDEAMLQYLRSAVRAKCNVLVSGGTGAGKTTLLNALSSFIPASERILTIEDAAELQLQQAHVARLETRPPNTEGRGEISIRDLVRNALRMRPDRIVVGEVRAAEVLDMMQAMNTGHEGSMTTIHANSAQEATTRLMAMLALAGTQLGEPMMRQMVARSLHLVVHVARYIDGQRRVAMIAEVVGSDDAAVKLQPVFAFDQSGITATGAVVGAFRAVGSSALGERFRAAGAGAQGSRPAPAGEGARR
ncbi:MAG: CpaF family protein [Proteobacteria bacterium]|nr:CpaF family protein [Pseudomonadota bacterium]